MNPLSYQSGFGNLFASESAPGLLPVGRNSPQRVAGGLFAELLSGTAFTAARHHNLRTWMYRRLPSVVTQPARAYEGAAHWLSDAGQGLAVPPNPMRWAPFGWPAQACDFVDGMHSLAVNGSPQAQSGVAVHVYLAERSMGRTALVNGDGEMLLVPQEGGLRITTECGVMDVAPGEIALLPRGMAFKVDLLAARARGYVCENFGAAFRLPELGPIGSNGLANARDFLSPVAAAEPETVQDYRIIRKSAGQFWLSQGNPTPFNVLAWHGNLVPCKYDTAHFMVIGSISFDHPDPSIFTVLTSASDTPGTANCDFVIFPPRWLVGEDTFRPPWYHRNVMSEFMGLVHGQYDAKEEGFRPGGASLHNAMVPHGPDSDAFHKASQAELKPQKLDHTLAFMFESRYLFRPSPFAMNHEGFEADYWRCWQGLNRPA